MDFHSKTLPEVRSILNAQDGGLSSKEALLRFQKLGANRLKEAHKIGVWMILWRQCFTPFILILSIAVIIKGSLGHAIDATVLAITMFLMIAIGFFQEIKAEKALKALQQYAAHKSKVVRDGKIVTLPSEELVVGDEIIIEAGDKIPADARLIESKSLRVDESMFTGESLPVDKTEEACPVDAGLAERSCMLHSGTVAVLGRARALITATGMHTELGRIAASIEEIKPAPTPLQRDVNAIGHWMLIWILVAIAIFIVISFFKGFSIVDIFLLGVAAAISAIPEGLPAAFTVTLAAGMNVMAKRHAIMRRMTAVETLGSTTVICTDKTGTLTLNKMKVQQVEGENFELILKIGALCNDATKERGDPTEKALLDIALENKIDLSAKRLEEIPFSSESLYMATSHVGGFIYVKGAPEKILSFCGSLNREEIEKKIEAMSSKGLRIIAVGFCKTDAPLSEEAFAGKLQFAGLMGLSDPPRKEVAAAIEACRRAGIRVKMITGDSQTTAEAIAEALGITEVEARVEPTRKLEIVQELQAQGEIVAMTGDGINDAPALEAANIGVAMGKAGTDVAKEAADMVLSDDRFDSIVAAIEEGRAIFNRLRNICAILLITCFGELLGLILSVLFLGEAPLEPLQILWVNLITGAIVTIPLGLEPKVGDELLQPPRSPKTRLLYRGMWLRIICFASLLGVSIFMTVLFNHSHTITLTAIVLFEWTLTLEMRSDEIASHKLGFFSNKPLLFALLLGAITHLSIIYIPFFSDLFGLSPLTAASWGRALIPAFFVFTIEVLRKQFFPTLFSKGKWL